MNDAPEVEPESRPQARKRGKWIRPKRYKIADKATQELILNPPPKPEPEFKGQEYVKGIKNESKYIFMCNEPGCFAKFTTAVSLTLHGIKHLNRKIRCEFCNMLFKAEEDMHQHISEFHPDPCKNPGGNPLQCKKCGKCSRDKMALWRHVRESHRDRKYPCPHCNFPFTRPENLKEHLRKQHPPKGQDLPSKVTCKTCGKEFAHNGALRYHIHQKHRGNPDYLRCVLCNTLYFSLTAYNRHMKMHINPTYIECHVCNVKFTNKHHMRRHKKSASHVKRMTQLGTKNNKVNFPMPIITGVKTATNPNLTKEELILLCKTNVVRIQLHKVDQHIMSQSGNKVEKLKPKLLQTPDEGLEANEAFSESEHGDDKKETQISIPNQHLSCVYCEKTFSNLEVVKSHESACYMKMKNKKISICPVCNKEFDKPYKLKLHSQTHASDRPFPCSYCNAFFKTKTGKIQHEKSSHFGIRQNNYCGRTFKCMYEGCSRVFARSEGVRRHVKTHHLGVRYTCEICKRIYKQKRTLKDHLRNDHADCPIRLHCKPCKRTYKNRSTYLAHSTKKRHWRKTREYNQRKLKRKKDNV